MGDWAISVDLHIDLDGSRRRRSLEEALRAAVRDGRLRSGERLPSSRALASDLGVARNTVADAYGQLVAEGWLDAHHGSGTRVAARPVPADPPPASAATGRPLRYDLRPGSPDLSSFPRQRWIAASRRALAGSPDDALGYGDPRGTIQLREALAGYLSRARGLRADPGRIVVCTGFTQGVGLICRALAVRGARTVAVEAYGLPANRRTIARSGRAVRPVPLDEHGAVIDAAGDADALVLTPAHQFPLGMVLSPARRNQAIEWARSVGAVIVEDDYDGEFRYDRQPLGALQGLDPDHVIYAGTASKTLAPGLRLAWLVVPDHLLDAVVAAKAEADRQTATLEQLTLAQFIAQGSYDRHIRRRRLTYRQRRDRLFDVVRRHPGCTLTGASAGLHVVLTLPPGWNEAGAVTAGARRGLGLEGLGQYATDTEGPAAAALVIGYATPPDHAYTTALARLGAVLDQLDSQSR